MKMVLNSFQIDLKHHRNVLRVLDGAPILKCFKQMIYFNKIAERKMTISIVLRKRIEKLIEMKVERTSHSMNSVVIYTHTHTHYKSKVPFRNNVIHAILCADAAAAAEWENFTEEKKRNVLIRLRSYVSFLAAQHNAHPKCNMNTNDNGMQCGGHAAKTCRFYNGNEHVRVETFEL